MLIAMFVAVLVVGVAVALSILLQTGKAGFGASFLGGGGGQQSMGRKRGLDDMLERVTVVLGAVLVVLLLVLGQMWK
jgi:preprotein translocase subunit SecG